MRVGLTPDSGVAWLPNVRMLFSLENVSLENKTHEAALAFKPFGRALENTNNGHEIRGKKAQCKNVTGSFTALTSKVACNT